MDGTLTESRPEQSPLLAGFPVITEIHVLWGDEDSFAHELRSLIPRLARLSTEPERSAPIISDSLARRLSAMPNAGERILDRRAHDRLFGNAVPVQGVESIAASAEDVIRSWTSEKEQLTK